MLQTPYEVAGDRQQEAVWPETNWGVVGEGEDTSEKRLLVG